MLLRGLSGTVIPMQTAYLADTVNIHPDGWIGPMRDRLVTRVQTILDANSTFFSIMHRPTKIIW